MADKPIEIKTIEEFQRVFGNFTVPTEVPQAVQNLYESGFCKDPPDCDCDEVDCMHAQQASGRLWVSRVVPAEEESKEEEENPLTPSK